MTMLDQDNFIVRQPGGCYLTSSKTLVNAMPYLRNDDLKNNRPDSILTLLGGFSSQRIALYKRSWEKRVKNQLGNTYNPELLYKNQEKPKIQLIHLSDSVCTSDPNLLMKLVITQQTCFLSRNMVYINGMSVFTKDIVKVKKYELELNLELSLGVNVVSIIAASEKGGVERLQFICSYFSDTAIQRKTYYVGIGVSGYKDSSRNLYYSANDVRAFTKFIESRFKNVITDTLVNNNATRENIFKLKNILSRTNVDDNVIFLMSGHGIRSTGTFYFATANTNFNEPEEEALSETDFLSLLSLGRSRRKILFLDACYGGKIDNDLSLPDANSLATDTTSAPSFKDVNTEQKPTGSQNSSEYFSTTNAYDLMLEEFLDIQDNNGAYIITASQGLQQANEPPGINNSTIQNSYFTYALINGIRNGSADTNEDDIIQVDELASYLEREVSELTGGKQIPSVKQVNLDYNWIISPSQ